MLILGIDTSGKNASVALYENGMFIAQKSVLTKLTHSQIIMPMVDDVLKSADKTLSDIDLFAAAIGPGSYTGLRIGVSAVKAIGFANNKPCVGVSVLKGMCYAANPRNCDVLCVAKARANLVYAAMYSADDDSITQIMPDCIIDINELAAKICTHTKSLMITGDAADDIKKICNNKNCFAAPLYLRISGAMGICLAAENENTVLADELVPAYFEVTKAEKELDAKNL